MNEALRRYLLRYSIELVVIFTGITLSFAFDQWRKERDNRSEERKALLSLQRDLARKQTELLSDSTGLTAIAGMTDSLRMGHVVVSDERYVQWVSLSWGTNYLFNPTTAAYKIVTQTGKLDLLTNDSLTASIVELHEYDLPGLAKAYTQHESFDALRFQPVARNIQWHLMRQPASFRRTVEALLATVENRDVLYWKSYMCRTHFNQVHDGLVEVRITLRHIAQQLAQMPH